ncbi:cell wall assembly regulator SMI1 [Mesonia hippocampi]|uniref:Cell wall assembly regulator SMI1 n=1 Tax=Mesonia hippocampi TaxID=1628250 RepID=A0A840ERX3_9FLAO|nr:SMI1/KNR4 family protein [Mesonia hippocampi]MBB4119283.1 cell wall assembly regulator SMI1 [Mesonia hippocampi]
MTNIIQYTEDLNKMKWDDFNFNAFQVNTLPPLKDPDHYNNCFVFRDSLLEAIEKHSGKEVFKLLLISPDNISSTKFYTIAFLEGKFILTAEIENTNLFSTWFSTLNRNKNNTKKLSSTIYSFGKNLFSSQPASNFKEKYSYKNTGALIADFIPNQFIAEKLAKEKADFLGNFIQLDAKIDFTKVKQHFETLLTEKELEIIPPKNNETIYTEFEQEAGFPFPAIIKNFLSLHNGVKNTAFMGAENILKEWKEWKAIYDDWTQEELLDTYSTNQGKTLLMYTTPYWIPFFDLQNGNFLAFDFAPNTKGIPGQIIRYGADQEIGYIHATSLIDFLEKLMDNEDEIIN